MDAYIDTLDLFDRGKVDHSGVTEVRVSCGSWETKCVSWEDEHVTSSDRGRTT